MKNIFLKTLLVYFIFTFNLYASPCSPEEIKFELEKMRLDPLIKTNVELLNSIEGIYGKKMLQVLINQHPLLKENPTQGIDRNTLEWINDMIWSQENQFIVYRYFPGDLSSQKALDYFVWDMYSTLESRQRTVPIFQHIGSRELFDILLKPNSENQVLEIMQRVNKHLTIVHNQYLTHRFVTHFRKYNEAKVGFNFTEGGEKILLEISGHSTAGMPGYLLGDEMVAVEDIVQNLVDMGLPLNTSIKLLGCFTACNSKNTPYTKTEVKQLFQQRRLNEIYDNGQSASFLQLFSFELKKRLPLFHGEVVGYIGEIMDLIDQNVFTLDGTHVTAFAVRVSAKDGEVLLKREESSFSIDFSKKILIDNKDPAIGAFPK